MNIFPDFLGLPPDFEDRILEATKRHWHELPDEVREVLTAVISGSAPLLSLYPVIGSDYKESPLLAAWYYALPEVTEEREPRPAVRAYWNSEALAALNKLEPSPA